jgi:rubrerythrin
MKPNCVHSCRGLCNALELAEHRERETLKEYRQYLGTCDYPDVREILMDLIRQREHALTALQEKRAILQTKFSTLDNINDSFS